MASSPTAFPPVSGGAFSAEDRRAAATWHGAWVAAVATGAALMLIGLGSAPWRTLLALALGAAPGLLGVLWRPRTLAQRAWILLAWAGAAGLAMALTGGIGGPLAVWGLTPVLASLAYGGLWRQGAARAFAALAAVAVIQAAGRLALPPTGGLGLWLGLTALGTSLGLGAAAVMMRADARREAAAAGPGSAATTSLPASPDPTAPAAATAGPALTARLEAAEAGRRDAEADARGKMRFLANMSHELRTPLNAIMGFSDIMRTKLFGELSPRYTEYAELIHESGGHLLDLINDVLDVSKIDADKYVLAREDFDVREAASAALRILRQQADDVGVQLRGVLPAEPLEVDADRRALKQIVLNLVSNALKFTPPGGSISVSFTAVAGALEIAVADTGVGIAPEDLARLGRPYEQAGDADDRARGTGLGLSLVRAFAKLHGGDMAMESRLGEGTAVTVRLPVLADTAVPGRVGELPRL